ncbi:MAG: YhbY family RNA-binding protein [Methanomicrobium sp.]|nr:YhbY family RNA-binding protein [Methanomicrobium sp.]MBQ3719341.1 YhbY family RNA-binding protein [Methanomicrobium sp.]
MINDKAYNKYTPKDLHELKATLWIGKMGCTDNIIEEIRRQTKNEDIIKVKWLRNTDIDPKAVAEESGTILLQARGRTMVLARGREKASRQSMQAQPQSQPKSPHANAAAGHGGRQAHKPSKSSNPSPKTKYAKSSSYARPSRGYGDYDEYDDDFGGSRRSSSSGSFAPHTPQRYAASDSRLGYMPKNSINSERRNPYTTHTRNSYRDSDSGAGRTSRPARPSGAGKSSKPGSRPAGRPSNSGAHRPHGGAKKPSKMRPTKSRQKISPDKRRH